MASPASRVTCSLHAGILGALAEAVARGTTPSKNALVERALWREPQAMRRQTRRAQWEDASRDPLFLDDLVETAAAFASVDSEITEESR